MAWSTRELAELTGRPASQPTGTTVNTIRHDLGSSTVFAARLAADQPVACPR